MNHIIVCYKNKTKLVNLNDLEINEIKNIEYYLQSQIKKVLYRIQYPLKLSINSMCKLTQRLGELNGILDTVINFLACKK